jgi:hypothetical protein
LEFETIKDKNMTSAKLFMFGQERDLLWVNTNYYRHIASKGDPASEIQGGFLNFGFLSQEDDEIFWYNLTKAIEQETDRMEKGEIRFYSKGDKDSHSRIYKFNDAYIVHFCQTFEAYGTENMQTVVTLSPAIQNYGIERDFVKYWQKSYPAPAAPFYYIPEKAKKETKVKTIEVLTVLDSGSANDNSGTGTQEGMLYGKTYEFKVVAFTQETPTDKSVIHWMYKYHSLSQNKWIEKKLPVKGETIKFTLNEKDMCGRFVHIRAYIKDPENEGELKLWKHNRFRWFDRMVVYDEIKERTDNNKPWLVNQSGTSLCGMACIFYLFAKEQPESYKRFAKELFRTGEATFNSYTVKPSIEILEKKIDFYGYPDLTINMPVIDYVTMAGTRNSNNSNYKGGDEEFDAINWPPLMTNLSEKLLGYKNVASHGIYNPIKKSKNYPVMLINKIIQDINEQIIKGYKITLMIDSDLIEDDPDFYLPKSLSIEELKKSIKSPFEFDYHWVVLESQINKYPWLAEDGKTEYKLDFKVYSWGSKNKYLKQQITFSQFINNFYGYIKVK